METVRSTLAKILVVDDDLVARQLMAASLEAHQFSTVVAASAPEARALLQARGTEAFDAVVTDYRMPGEDGLAFLSWLTEQDASLATIMVTAEGEKKLIAESLRKGVHDFHEKPLSIVEFVASVSRAVQSTLRQRHLRAAESAVREIAHLQQALVQMHSSSLQDRLEINYFPKQDAGGDFVSIFPIGPQQFLVVATDVSGHDLRAAFIASYFQGIVRGMMEKQARIEEVFHFFNDFLVRDWNRADNWNSSSPIQTSLAACAVHVDLEHRSARILNCGFPIPLSLDREGRARPLVDEGSNPLGWFAQPDLAIKTIEIDHAGFLVLWSDGLEELADGMGVDPHAVAFALRAAVREKQKLPKFLSEARDDVMNVLINTGDLLGGSREKHASLLVAQKLRGHTASQIDEYQKFWSSSLITSGLVVSEMKFFSLLLCTREAVLNALKHGCEDLPEREAFLQISFLPETDSLRVEISDPGPGHNFDFETHEKRASDELLEEHRGMILLRNMSDRLVTQNRGATLILYFNLT